MLVLALSWIALLAVSMAWGAWFMQRTADARAPFESSMLALGGAWLGLHLLGWFFFVLALFVSLSPSVLLASWALACFGAIAAAAAAVRAMRGAGVASPGIAILLVFVALAFALAERSTWIGNLNDTGGYHWNIVQWMNAHGVVPGLGLFQIRLATSSSWLALTAALNIGPLEERVLSLANGALFLVACGLFAITALRIRRGSMRQSDWFFAAGLFLLVPNMLRWDMRLSPSPDIPVIMAPVFFAWCVLRAEEAHRAGAAAASKFPGPWSVPVLFAGVAVTVKLSALPLLPVAVAAYALHPDGTHNFARRAFRGALLAGILLGPLVATSLVLTGCPLYPSALGCFDWPTGIGSQAAREYSRLVREMSEWGISGLIVLSAIGAAALLPAWKRMTFSAWVIVALAALSIAFVLVFAPTGRFARGYLLLLPALAIAVHREWLFEKISRVARRVRGVAVPGAVLLLTVAFAWPLYKSELGSPGSPIDMTINAPNPDRLLWPARLHYEGRLREERVGDFRYAYLVEGTCWNVPIPCASNLGWPFIQDIRLTDPADMGRGFVRR